MGLRPPDPLLVGAGAPPQCLLIFIFKRWGGKINLKCLKMQDRSRQSRFARLPASALHFFNSLYQSLNPSWRPPVEQLGSLRSPTCSTWGLQLTCFCSQPYSPYKFHKPLYTYTCKITSQIKSTKKYFCIYNVFSPCYLSSLIPDYFKIMNSSYL